jgi:hypothetical protein
MRETYLLQVENLDVVVESFATDDNVMSPRSNFSPAAGFSALGLTNAAKVSELSSIGNLK